MAIKIKRGIEVKRETLQKYRQLLPKELLEVWEKYGYAELLDGYLRIVDPDDYQELINETYFRGKMSIPILTTAFGDVLTFEENQYISMIMYKNGGFHVISAKFKRFLNNLEDKHFQEDYFQLPKYEEAVKRLGYIAHDECFGYVPLLGLGGSEKVENLQIVKIREHIEMITQMVGKIGM